MIAASLLIGFASFAYGFLEGTLDLPPFPMIWILPIMIGLFAVFANVFKWMYR
jgi:ABC-type Mn2+/Zn2+ transport system permease subunit